MRKLLTVSAILVTAARLWAAEFIPVTSGEFTTGQWYFDGQKSALAGNAALTFVPAVKFPTGLSLLPTVESNYRGTRSAEELAGGNTLFQDTWENGLGLKAVKEYSDEWVSRLRASGRVKWYRETSDENWGKGLYDYRTETIGGELERRWDRDFSLAAGYDFSLLQFPNYSSLESSQTSDDAREFAGNHVLDSRVHILSLRAGAALPWRVNAALSTYYSPRLYDDQTVVVRSGLLSPTKRVDYTSGATLSLDRTFRTTRASALSVSLLYGYTNVDSNQNHYDARVTTYVGDFYDYGQQSFGSQLQFGFGKLAAGPMLLQLSGAYDLRNYSKRVIQDSDGNYLSEKLHSTDSSITTAFSYPISKTFHARVSSSFGRSRSNNQYEAVYRYNYSSANYQFGFTYEY